MHFRPALCAALALGLAAGLAACDQPKPRKPPPPREAAQAAPPAEPSERQGPVRWNAQAGRFELNGKPIRTARFWDFRDTTGGFVAGGGQAALAPRGGLAIRNTAFDPVLFSPQGLAIDGSRYPLVIVRLTRTKAGGGWAGQLFYSTDKHPMSEDFRGKLVDPRDPGVNETVTLVFDMARPATGAGDWTSSVIDQFRFDGDDLAGGEFVIHQIAVGENPDPAALAPAGELNGPSSTPK